MLERNKANGFNDKHSCNLITLTANLVGNEMFPCFISHCRYHSVNLHNRNISIKQSTDRNSERVIDKSQLLSVRDDACSSFMIVSKEWKQNRKQTAYNLMLRVTPAFEDSSLWLKYRLCDLSLSFLVLKISARDLDIRENMCVCLWKSSRFTHIKHLRGAFACECFSLNPLLAFYLEIVLTTWN